ncbi:hypothetical protein CVT24_001539 [Panaeolus cyanescens]|uniref:Uncharacterized protein n=1 Tax=Panaeolus cyanescens TaxID=181874 RepID=A0A409YF57_9AGAR|nr:hypothetical protein CVT24_001539 [Panaeolus cyanescens]
MSRTKENDLRIVVAVGTVTPKTVQICILEYNYWTGIPKNHSFYMNYWDKWPFNGRSPVYATSQDYFVLIRGSVLYCWNFMNNRHSRWAVPEQNYIRMDAESNPSLIIFMTCSKLYGWVPTDGKNTTDVQPFIPTFSYDLPEVTHGPDIVQRSLATWYGSTEFSLIFDLISRVPGDTKYTITTCELHLPDSNGEGGCVKHLSTERFPYRSDRNVSFQQFYVYRVSHGRLFKMCWDGAQQGAPTSYVKVFFRDDPRTPTDGLEGDPMVEVDLHFPDKRGMEDADANTSLIDANVDFASGRLCYLLQRGTAVGVVDYLLPAP